VNYSVLLSYANNILAQSFGKSEFEVALGRSFDKSATTMSASPNSREKKREHFAISDTPVLMLPPQSIQRALCEQAPG
jgi:hypothetical protein